MVLDGNVDPRKVWYQANLDQDVAFERNIEDLVRLARQVRQRLPPRQDRQGGRAALVRGAEQARAATPAGGVVGPDEWTDIFLYAGYYQSTWLDLADAFAGWVNDHDRRPVVAAYEQLRSAPATTTASRSTTRCSAPTSSGRRAGATWQRDNWRTYLKAPFVTWDNAWYNAPCLYWPAKAAQAGQGRRLEGPERAAVDETLDAATPFEGSLEVRRCFPHARLLAEPGGTTHANSLNGNACVDNTIADYLATGKLPARKPGDRPDATCDAAAAARPDRGRRCRRSRCRADSSVTRGAAYPVPTSSSARSGAADLGGPALRVCLLLDDELDAAVDRLGGVVGVGDLRAGLAEALRPIRSAAMPSETSVSRTVLARASLSAWLRASVPVLSV